MSTDNQGEQSNLDRDEAIISCRICRSGTDIEFCQLEKVIFE
jgi:hypothetical protein